MTEKLLQFIWQNQLYRNSDLSTITDEKLLIIDPGKLNTNQGPDFSNAMIRINNTILAGNIELHLKSRDWKAHGHQYDPNYRNVILHVVLINNDSGYPGIPVMEIGPRISKLLWQRYQVLMENQYSIPCSKNIDLVRKHTWTVWKPALVKQRLSRKSEEINKFQQQNKAHWEESFWWMLARNFGVKTNSDAFEAIARSIPLNVLSRHKNRIHHLEAILLGQAGLLSNDFNDDYAKLLHREYSFLNSKYHFKKPAVPVNFLRMRPGNFPTIRLAQLAALIQQSKHLFNTILETPDIEEVKLLFNVTANDYWHYRYNFDQVSNFKKKNLGQEMIENILINTVIPMIFSFGLHHKDQKHINRAISWLGILNPESNSITEKFINMSLSNKSAHDSQAYIELKTRYCDHKLCLECAIGNAILRKP